MENKQSNSFMTFLNDPSQVIKSTKFSMATAGIQFIGLTFFAIIGASISFRFESFRDLADLNYWITVVVLLVEQLYAYNIGYGLGRALQLNANEELDKTNKQITAIIEGAKREDGTEIEALKKDSAYIEEAIEILSNEDKVNLVTKRMKEIIKIFESKLDYFKTLNTKGWLFPRKIKIGSRAKHFWKRATLIKYCELQIKNGKEMLDNEEAILAVPDKNIAGYQRLEYANIMSSQDEIVQGSVSRYHQRSENKERAKKAGTKALKKFGMSAIGGSIVFGALAGSQALGMIIYTIFLMIVQVASGFKFGSDTVIKVILYNATNRLKALQDIRKLLPTIKNKEKEQKPQEETITETELTYNNEPQYNISPN